MTVVAAALTGLQNTHTFFDLPFEALGVVRADGAHYYRQGLPGESEDQFGLRMAQELEQLILR